MWSRAFLVLCLFCIAPSLASEEKSKEDTMPFVLRWQEVPGATAYIIEIRNPTGVVIVSEKLNQTFYNVKSLGSGSFEHRIGLVNKLGKTESFTDWVGFEIIVARVPSLSRDRVYYAAKEEKSKTLVLEGKDFIDPLQVYLTMDDKKWNAKKISFESSNKIIVDFEISPDQKTGIYDLIIENPRNKRLNAKQRFVLSDTKERAVRFANRQERIIKKEIPEDYYNTPYWSTFWRSLLLPGWGQKYIDGQNWKFWVYPVIAVGVAGAYANSYNNFLSARSDYNTAVNLGILLSEDPTLQIAWFLNQSSADSAFNKAKQELSIIQGGVGLLGVFAIYNVIDSYYAAKRNVAWERRGIPVFEEKVRLHSSWDTSQWGGQRQWETHWEFRMHF